MNGIQMWLAGAKELASRIARGDVGGHDFHGNQYKEGAAGSERPGSGLGAGRTMGSGTDKAGGPNKPMRTQAEIAAAGPSRAGQILDQHSAAQENNLGKITGHDAIDQHLRDAHGMSNPSQAHSPYAGAQFHDAAHLRGGGFGTPHTH